MLEVMVHVPNYRQLNDRIAIPVSFDEALVENVDPSLLPMGWRRSPPSPAVQSLGDDWIQGGTAPESSRTLRKVVLRVPGVVIPDLETIQEGFNYLINPQHPDFVKLHIGSPIGLQYDPRLLK
jgi:hypothetical protein